MKTNNRHYAYSNLPANSIMIIGKSGEDLIRPRSFTQSVVVTFMGRSSALPTILRRREDKKKSRNARM